jgi:hypothetical protein
MEPRIGSGAGGDGSRAAPAVSEQLDRLLVRAKVEGGRLDIVRPLRNPPDAAGHFDHVNAGTLRELSEHEGVEGDLNPMLRLVAPTGLGISDSDRDAAVSRLDDYKIGDTRSWKHANNPSDSCLKENPRLDRASPELLNRRLDVAIGQIDENPAI